MITLFFLLLSHLSNQITPLVAAQLTGNPGGTTVITLFFPLLHVHNPNENLEVLLLVVGGGVHLCVGVG